MKNALLFLSLLFYTNVYGNIVLKSNESCCILNTNTEKQINLQGSISSSGTRTLAQPITLSQETDYLQANFTNSLGCINVFIYDDLGNIKYQKEINTAVEPNLYIDTSILDAGNYIITFVNSKNQSLIGNFDL